MHSKAKRPTKAERERMARIVDFGCICCWREGDGRYVAEIHHLLDGGVRRGHAFTVGLCGWHHRGVVDRDWTTALMLRWHGPSLAHGSRPFREKYGSDDELLAYQNRLLENA